MPTPQDTREIDPELRAEIEAAYATNEQPTGGFADTAPETKAQPFMKSLKTDAVVDLTEEARLRSFERPVSRESEIEQIIMYTKYINDLRERALGGRGE